MVAPLAGSVDRNICCLEDKEQVHDVAPLAGSVDRNSSLSSNLGGIASSLPSRGAWIEMMDSFLICWELSSRSPRGERG